jgi:hypothetical protein
MAMLILVVHLLKLQKIHGRMSEEVSHDVELMI